MKKGFTVVVLIAFVQLAYAGAMSERERLFNQDYQTLFNKYTEFDSYTFRKEGDNHDTKSIQLKVITNPPLTPDKKIYYVHGFVSKKQGNAYVAELSIGSNLFYFAFADKVETARGKENIKNLSLKDGVSIIGRYVGLAPYTTVAGIEKHMPIFEALHVEPCKPSKYSNRSYCAIYQ